MHGSFYMMDAQERIGEMLHRKSKLIEEMVPVYLADPEFGQHLVQDANRIAMEIAKRLLSEDSAKAS